MRFPVLTIYMLALFCLLGCSTNFDWDKASLTQVWSPPTEGDGSEFFAQALESAITALAAVKSVEQLPRHQRADFQLGHGWYFGELEWSIGSGVFGMPDGVGRFTINRNSRKWAGNVYAGTWLAFPEGSFFDGHGMYHFNAEGPQKGMTYVGQWKKGEPWGWGVYVWPNGEEYYGYFRQGELDLSQCAAISSSRSMASSESSAERDLVNSAEVDKVKPRCKPVHLAPDVIPLQVLPWIENRHAG